jgi:Fic/DOC family
MGVNRHARLMTELVTWFVDERHTKRLHPLLLIGVWVVVFLEIHPFQDGNGRLSRVLTARSPVWLCKLMWRWPSTLKFFDGQERVPALSRRPQLGLSVSFRRR